MKYILAATEDLTAATIVRTAFRRLFHVDQVSTIRRGVDLYWKKWVEKSYIFVRFSPETAEGSIGRRKPPVSRSVR
jgi:hypothetical protein